MPEQQIPLKLFRQQATITRYERDRFGSTFGEITPDKLRQILDDAKKGNTSEYIELCKHALKTDGHFFNVVDIRKKRCLAALDKHHIMPGKSMDPKAQSMAAKAAQLCDTAASNIRPFKTKLSKVLDAIGDGFSATELVWGRDSGYNVIKDLKWVHARRFRWDDKWNLRLYDYGLHNGPDEYGEPIEPDIWMILVSLDEGVYPGEAGVIQKGIWPWLFKMWVNRYHIHATERYGQPFISATVPKGSESSVRTGVLSKLEQLSYDTVGVFEEGTEVVFQGGPSTVNNGEMFETYLDRADKTQTKAVLGATDIVEQGTQGSQAAVSERVDVTLDPKTIIDLELLFEAIEKQIFEPMLRYNFQQHFGGILPPTPRFEPKDAARPIYEPKGPQEPAQPTEPATQPEPAPMQAEPKKKLSKPHSKTSTQRTFKFSTNPLEKALSSGLEDSDS